MTSMKMYDTKREMSASAESGAENEINDTAVTLNASPQVEKNRRYQSSRVSIGSANNLAGVYADQPIYYAPELHNPQIVHTSSTIAMTNRIPTSAPDVTFAR